MGRSCTVLPSDVHRAVAGERAFRPIDELGEVEQEGDLYLILRRGPEGEPGGQGEQAPPLV
jgi:hypothetical protein